MPIPLDTVAIGLATAWTTGGTVTIAYPAGRSRGDYLLSTGHTISWNGRTFLWGRDFTIALNATTVVFTMVATATIPAGQTIYASLNRNGANDSSFEGGLDDFGNAAGTTKSGVQFAPTLLVSLGSPIAISTTGIRTSLTFSAPGTTLAGAVALVLDGARVTAGKAHLDIPRALTITSASNLASFVFRITGLDTAGAAMVEEITGVNANTVAGKKAFSRVDSVVVYGTGTPNAVSIGFGKVLGLPLFLASSKFILSEMENGATPGGGAGTVVAGVTSTATATTGDTRGTISPTATPDGSIAFHLLVAAANVEPGVPQFAG